MDITAEIRESHDQMTAKEGITFIKARQAIRRVWQWYRVICTIIFTLFVLLFFYMHVS